MGFKFSSMCPQELVPMTNLGKVWVPNKLKWNFSSFQQKVPLNTGPTAAPGFVQTKADIIWRKWYHLDIILENKNKIVNIQPGLNAIICLGRQSEIWVTRPLKVHILLIYKKWLHKSSSSQLQTGHPSTKTSLQQPATPRAQRGPRQWRDPKIGLHELQGQSASSSTNVKSTVKKSREKGQP